MPEKCFNPEETRKTTITSSTRCGQIPIKWEIEKNNFVFSSIGLYIIPGEYIFVRNYINILPHFRLFFSNTHYLEYETTVKHTPFIRRTTSYEEQQLLM